MAKKKSAYIEKREAVNRAMLDAGEELGMQKMWDYIQIALRDKETVGKDVFGPVRLRKLYKKLKELCNDYHTAFTDHKEADWYQEKMDRELHEIWGENFSPFYERYPMIKKAKYERKRGWMD